MSNSLDQLIEVMTSIPVDTWAAGSTAAALHPLDGYILRPPFHLMVERQHNVRRIGHFVHTTNSLERIDRGWAQGVPVLSPTRTLLHLAALDSVERVEIAIDSALRDGLTLEDFIHRRLSALRTSGRDGVRPLLRALEGQEIVRGGQSWLEREFLRLVHGSSLPRPLTQQVLGRRGTTLIRVDCQFPGTNLVIELLGYRWHRTKPQLHIDVQRINELTLRGYLVLQFTYPQVVDTPAWVLDQVREGLAVA
jgi:very-short-patch-repair endonuclease